MSEIGSAPASAPRLSVVVPAFQEERRLGPTLDAIATYLTARATPYEILVVDDGSSDGTLAVAQERAALGVVALRLPRNRGKGAAVREGVRASRGALVLLCDADLATPIEDLERLEPHLARTPIVFGSRARSDSDIVERQPWYRQNMGRTFNLVLRVAGIRGLRDTQCGFKLLDGELARRLFALLRVDRFAYDAELAFVARRLGHPVAEVGVRWRHVERSSVRLLSDSARMLLDVARFRFAHRKLGPGAVAPTAPAEDRLGGSLRSG